MNLLNCIEHGDCLEVMKLIPDASIDMILCDLPYGTTGCKWDTIIDLPSMWSEYMRIVKDETPIVLTASQPFASKLVFSNFDLFKYEIIWKKSRCTGYFDVQYRPMKQHENVLIFGRGGVSNCSNPRMNYTPIATELKTKKKRTLKTVNATCRSSCEKGGEQTHENFPRSVVEFDNEGGTIHPTQKPVALLEWLIRLYSNEGAVVLDNCIGSGTTAIAAINTGRNFIGIEKDKEMYDKCCIRVSQHLEGL